MKKIFMTGIAMLMVLTLVACGGGKKAENLVITLDENPTTGYTWKFVIEDEGIVKAVSDNFEAPKGDSTGAGGKHTYEFAGVKKGETTITFTSKRDWEGGETAETKTVKVMVDDNKTVTEKK